MGMVNARNGHDNQATTRPVIAVLALGLAGCSTDRLTEPLQTATEELLVSTAIDRAVE